MRFLGWSAGGWFGLSWGPSGRWWIAAGLVGLLGVGASPAEEGRDRLGDPLPPRAVARLGSTRLAAGQQPLAVAIAADGSTVAAVDPRLGELCVWEAPDWRLRWAASLRVLGQFGLFDNARLVFSPDGRKLALNHPDDRLRVWDARTGRLLRILRPAPFCGPIAFSPGSDRLLSLDGYDVEVWDVETGKRLARWNGFDHPFEAAWLPGGDRVVLNDDRGKRFRLWDVGTGREISHWDLPEGSGDARLAPDGRLVAVLDRAKKRVHLLDAATGKKVRQIDDLGPLRRDVVFSPDGGSLVGAGKDAVLRGWSVEGKLTRSVQVRPGSIESVVVSTGARTAVFASAVDQVLHVWDLEKGLTLHQPAGHVCGTLAVTFAAAGKEVLTAAQANDWKSSERAYAVGTEPQRWPAWSLRRWDAATGREKGVIDRDLGHAVEHVVFSPDGRRAAVVLQDACTLHLWDAERGVEVWHGKLPTYARHLLPDGSEVPAQLAIDNGCFSADGKTLLAAGAKVYRWDATDGKELIAFDLGDEVLLRLPNNGTLCPRLLPVHRYGYRKPSELLLLDAVRGGLRATLPSPPGEGDVSLSPDGRTLAVVSEGRVRLFETATGSARGEVHDVDQQKYSGGALAFSPDGRLLAVTTNEGRDVLVWDVLRAAERATLRGHRGEVCSLAFSPDSRRLASGAGDTVAYVWDVTGPDRVERIEEKGLEVLWSDLHAPDGERAFRAVCRLAGDPERSVPFLRRRLLGPADDAAAIARLIAQLDDEKFEVREAASAELSRLGVRAAPPLLRARDNKPSPEVKRRIEALLAKLPAGKVPSVELVRARALEALEYAGTADARQVIEEAARASP